MDHFFDTLGVFQYWGFRGVVGDLEVLTRLQSRNYLDTGRAVADNRHFLSRVLIILWPVCAMDELTLEIV